MQLFWNSGVVLRARHESPFLEVMAFSMLPPDLRLKSLLVFPLLLSPKQTAHPARPCESTQLKKSKVKAPLISGLGSPSLLTTKKFSPRSVSFDGVLDLGRFTDDFGTHRCRLCQTLGSEYPRIGT